MVRFGSLSFTGPQSKICTPAHITAVQAIVSDFPFIKINEGMWFTLREYVYALFCVGFGLLCRWQINKSTGGGIQNHFPCVPVHLQEGYTAYNVPHISLECYQDVLLWSYLTCWLCSMEIQRISKVIVGSCLGILNVGAAFCGSC